MSTDQSSTPTPRNLAADETDTLLERLDGLRSYIAWKFGGLDAEQMRATLGPSTMTLGGLVKHLALVEADHFSRQLLRAGPGEPWESVDWDADPDCEWRTAADDTPEELWALWHDAVARSRALVADAAADGGMDHLGAYTTDDGRSPNLRRVVLDMIEEYARHLGHADLIRESIDGLVGEDPA